MAGFNDWITLEGNPGEVPVCSLDFSSVQLLNRKEAIDHTVNAICRYGKDIFVSLSGGMDSEFVAQSLFDRSIKFYPVIVDYQTNAAEAWYAYNWCRVNGVKPIVIKLTREMVQASFSSLAKKYCTMYVGAVNFIVEHFVNSKGGVMINGSWDPFEPVSCSDDKLDKQMDTYLYLESYQLDIDIAFPNRNPVGFLFQTPEMFYSSIAELDYSKPAQIAKSKFYGVNSRPKLAADHNFMKSPTLFNEFCTVNAETKYFTIGIGEKEDVLEIIRNRGKIDCTITSNKT